MTLIGAMRPVEWTATSNPADCSQFLGLDPDADGLLDWDVLEGVLVPGELILLQSWRTGAAAKAFELTTELPRDGRLRRVWSSGITASSIGAKRFIIIRLLRGPMVEQTSGPSAEVTAWAAVASSIQWR